MIGGGGVFDLVRQGGIVMAPLALCSVVSVAVIVDPTVIASASCHVPPAPLKVMGKSIVLPLLVIVFVPEVAKKSLRPAPAPTVMPADNVRLP